jgi:hypothetical protein
MGRKNNHFHPLSGMGIGDVNGNQAEGRVGSLPSENQNLRMNFGAQPVFDSE